MDYDPRDPYKENGAGKKALAGFAWFMGALIWLVLLVAVTVIATQDQTIEQQRDLILALLAAFPVVVTIKIVSVLSSNSIARAFALPINAVEGLTSGILEIPAALLGFIGKVIGKPFKILGKVFTKFDDFVDDVFGAVGGVISFVVVGAVGLLGAGLFIYAVFAFPLPVIAITLILILLVLLSRR